MPTGQVFRWHCRAITHPRSEEHTSELQSRLHLVCRLLLEKKKNPHLLAAVRSRHVDAKLSDVGSFIENAYAYPHDPAHDALPRVATIVVASQRVTIGHSSR